MDIDFSRQGIKLVFIMYNVFALWTIMSLLIV